MRNKIITTTIFCIISWVIWVLLLFYLRDEFFPEQLLTLKFTILDGIVLIVFYLVFKCYIILYEKSFFKFFPWLLLNYIIFYGLINPLSAMMAPIQRIVVNTLLQTLFIILFWECIGLRKGNRK
jgi:RsiW-degrading membrane proteinase PrsW (M82 family)